MIWKLHFFVICFFVGIALLFFYKILFGLVPFPGDLLVGEYAPYSAYPFLGYSPGGYPHKAQDFDVLKLLYPGKEFAIDMFKKGEFPLWNPYNFSGNPHLASLQAGSFYPLNIIFFILPFISAWSIHIIIQPILAGIFTFLLLRELRLSIKSALFGSITFAFSSYLVVWMEYGNIVHSILWLPLSMWLCLKNLQKTSVVYSFALILALTFSFLAGYIQTTFYLFIFLFAFVVLGIAVQHRKHWFTKLLIFIPLFVLPILLSAVQLLPMIELFFNSARSSYETSSFIKLLIPQFHLATLFAPDFFGNPATRNYWISGTYIERVSYIGVLPLFFAVYGFFQKRTVFTWFFTVSLIIVYLLTFDTFIARVFYSLNIPFISTAVPSRMMYIFCFSASILAAFGLHSFENSKKTKPLLKTALITGGVYGFLWVFVFIAPIIFQNAAWVLNITVSKRNLILPSVIFLMGIALLLFSHQSGRVKKYIFVAVLALTIFDLFYFFQKITPFAPKESVYPQTEVFTYLKNIQGINRSWGYGSGYIEANIQTYEKIFSPDGYDALHIKRYGELASASKDGTIADSLPRSDVNLAPGYGASDLRSNYYRKRILDLLGVKYVFNKIASQNTDSKPDYQTFPEDTYKLVWQKGAWQIYENKKALPRIFLVSDYVVKSNKEKIIEKILDRRLDLREIVILEEPIKEKIKFKKDNEAMVEVKSYAPNNVVLKTVSKSPMILFLSDNYFPGWKMNVDGKNERIYRANYSFRAVPVEEGSHEIVFWYYPDSFDLGLKISIITLLSLLLVTVILKIRKINV